jgi:hypothetical protein
MIWLAHTTTKPTSPNEIAHRIGLHDQKQIGNHVTLFTTQSKFSSN